MRFFLKLFFSFWITLIMMAGLVAWAASQLRDSFERQLPSTMMHQAEERKALAALMAREGAESVRQRLSSLANRDGFLVFDGSGRELLARSMPGTHLQTIEAMEKSGVLTPLAATAPDGETYSFHLRPPHPSLFRVATDNPLYLLLIIILNGVVVFLLAFHFTRPIKKLRDASLKLAEGDMGARCQSISLRVPDELSHLIHDFNFMADRLEKLFHAHKRLLRDISHELRSPLARMRVASALIQPSIPDSCENYKQLEIEMERLDNLIGQIISLSRPDSVWHVASHDWIDLNCLIETVVADVRYEAGQGGRMVELDLSETVIIKADGTQLRSALENIIRNALRYTPEKRSVMVTSVQNGQTAIITVYDEGNGVPEEQLEEIFKPFYRVEEDRGQERGGFGLGLAIASRAIKNNNGTIKAANRLEGGLVVTVCLPIPKESRDFMESSNGSES
ncbi:MAG: HAMP domain-containing protein [Magnetococcales bacterium]|nr:HAMP domain-containing protein [Magnetococcales bacterium]